MVVLKYFKDCFQIMNFSSYLVTIVVMAIILQFVIFFFGKTPSNQEISFPDEHDMLLNSMVVMVSNGCIISASIPMFVEVLLDYLMGDDQKLQWLFIRERIFILVGLICPPIGYFIAYAYFPFSIAAIVNTLSSTQDLFLMGPVFSIIHKASNGKIWTSVNLLLITLCVGISHIISPYTNQNLPFLMLSYFVRVVALIVFVFCYIKMIIDINWHSNRMSSRDFLIYFYTSLVFVVIVFHDLVPLAFSSNQIVSLSYFNFTSILFTVLVSVVPSRVTRIELSSLNETLRLKQSFVRYLSHEMRTPINITNIGNTII